MEDTAYRAIAIVGAGAVLPDAPNVAAFWENVKKGRYSITEVPLRPLGSVVFITTPIPKLLTRPIRKSAAGCAMHVWDPMKWHLPIPPRVTDAMDQAQKWAIAATREALEDYGYPKRPLDPDRVAVILGNAMAGEKHYQTALRVNFPEYTHELAEIASFAALPEADSRMRLPANCTTELANACPKLRKTACPANWPTALPDASPTSTTSTVRTLFVTRRARPPWRR